MVRRFIMIRCVAALVGLALLASSSAAAAQSVLAFRDGNGEWRWIEAGAAPSVARKASDADDTVGTMFTVTYEDVTSETGVGFDDPDFGAARRDTLHAVLRYLSLVLEAPGTADLLVRASQTDGRGALASAGPYLRPLSGFQGGLVFEHLTTGVDPLPDELDGTVTVDFGHPWSTDLDGPSPTELDLYSTLLHEVTHALGILSIVGSDGASALGNQGGFGLFTFFDSMLVRGSTGQPLYLADGEINASAEDITSGDVLFAGDRATAAFGSSPPVFAPSPFLEGSSIGHWSFASAADAVMLAAVARGEQRRTFLPWELQALADLGYDVADDGFPVDAGVPDPPSDSGVPTDSPPMDEDPAPSDSSDAMGSDAEQDAPRSLQSSGGCSASRRHGGVVWPIVMALLVTRRRGHGGREKRRG
jgi:hypothetical protein